MLHGGAIVRQGCALLFRLFQGPQKQVPIYHLRRLYRPKGGAVRGGGNEAPFKDLDGILHRDGRGRCPVAVGRPDDLIDELRGDERPGPVVDGRQPDLFGKGQQPQLHRLLAAASALDNRADLGKSGA